MTERFEEKLAKPTNMSYCGPDCYFPVSGFQTLSDENNSMNQKMGDFGGYCLAWSIWYAEHKMINLKVEPKDLIRKIINKFMKMNIKPMEYIRNYANYISRFRLGYLKKIGCKCMGFHNGRDSMFSASKAKRSVSLVMPLVLFSSMVMALNQ